MKNKNGGPAVKFCRYIAYQRTIQHNDTLVKLRMEFLACLFKFTGKCKSV